MDHRDSVKTVVLAVGAHPDDVEFAMAGTLVLLKRAGASIHIWSLTDGSLGSSTLSRKDASVVRLKEAEAAASLAGATLHAPIAADMRLSCGPELLARSTAVVREVRPSVMLVHAPEDYHPDHESACRIAVSAAFARSLPGLVTEPAARAWGGDTTIYHCQPFANRDPLRWRVRAGQYVNIGEAMDLKRRMLRMHVSQCEWMRDSQGIDFIEAMEHMASETANASGRFEYAEGWRRRLHAGFSTEDVDPLSDILGPSCWTDPEYESALE
ncbi:MAG TPA: PIG-L family deacetylase [Candidatus Anoxymicrobiaceae bacterium]